MSQVLSRLSWVQLSALIHAIVLVVWGKVATFELVRSREEYGWRFFGTVFRELANGHRQVKLEVEETSRRRCSLLLLQHVSECLVHRARTEIMRDFLAEVYGLVAKQRSKEALTLIFNFIDVRMLEDRFAEVDTIFCHLHVKEIDPACMVGFLSVTFAGREHLRWWNGLRLRCRDECAARGMDPEKLERLFDDASFARRDEKSQLDPEAAP